MMLSPHPTPTPTLPREGGGGEGQGERGYLVLEIIMRNIAVEILKNKSVEEHDVEIVERKGVGHPDYICDAIMDSISVALSQEYLKRFGDILHHNIDKGLLAAGQVERRFCGGRVLKPMELIIGDRATYRIGNKKIDVEGIAIETAKKWFQKSLRFVDAEKDVKYRNPSSRGWRRRC